MSSITRRLRSFITSESASTDYAARKRALIRSNLDWLLNKTSVMFEYTNLPPTIPSIALERLLQWCGTCVIWRVPESYTPIGYGPSFNYSSLSTKISASPENSLSGKTDFSDLYAFNYTLADAPDPYDEPYRVVVNSPGFSPTISETLTLNKDCVIIRNDTNYRGLYSLHRKYAELMAEAEISLRSTLLVLRDQLLFIAKTESQRKAVEAYIESRDLGKPGFITAAELGTPLETITQNTHSNAVELAVNGLQAIKSAWFNELGLDPSFSLKREYTSAQEIDTNTDLLLPIIDDMYQSRRIGIENVNAMFGTNITVSKSSAWKMRERQIELGQEMEEATVELTQAQAEAAERNRNSESSDDSSLSGKTEFSADSDTVSELSDDMEEVKSNE